MKKTVLLLLVTLGNFLNGFSQSIEVKHNQYIHYTTDQGLPQAFISRIIQDKDGFIWVATMNGLARFDGKNFKIFNTVSPQGQRLSSNQLNDIYLGDNHLLWLLFPQGVVNVINTRTFEVDNNPKPFLKASIDKFPLKFDFGKTLNFLNGGNGYWFTANDDYFLLFDSTKKELVRAFKNKQKKQFKRIYSYTPHPDGGFYVLTDSAFYLLDKNFDSYKKLNTEVNLYHTLKPKQNIILADGSMFYDSEYFFGRYFPESDKGEKLDFSQLNIPNARFNHICTSDKQGGVISSVGDYIVRYTIENEYEILWHYPGRSDLKVNALLVDNTNVLWVGTDANGLFKIDLNKGAVHSSALEYNFVVDLLRNEFEIPLENIPENWLKNRATYGLRYSYTPKGKLLITQEGYGFGDQRIVYIVGNNRLKKLNLADIYQKEICGLSSSNEGLWAIDKYLTLFFWKDYDLNAIPDSIKLMESYSRDGPFVQDFLSDQGSQWILLENNDFIRVEKGSIKKTFNLNTISTGFIDLHQDKDSSNIIWIGGLTGGLVKWDKQKEEVVKRYTLKNGLSNDNVTGILEDSIGNLWIPTFNGLNRFNKLTERFTNYSLKDGLLESEFNRNHNLELKDGRMAFGGMNSLIILNPYGFKVDQFNPSTEIVGLKINEKSVAYNPDSSLMSQSFAELTELELEYFQNNLTFEIASTHYNDLEKSRLRYQLKEYNSSWITLENQSAFRLDNVRPGNYELLLNASNSDGIWSDKIKTIIIKISPPPWFSWWAFLLYALLTFSVFFIIWRNYKNRLIRNQNLIFNQKEAARLREMDEMKTRFFSNVTHEFRTPLTLILTPLERYLNKENPSQEVSRILNSTYKNANQLLKLVNQLLDINKIESGNMKNNVAVGDITEFCQTIVNDFKVTANSKNIILQFEGASNSHYFFNQPHLERILYNLLSNAIKFTDSGGKVLLSLSIKDNAEPQNSNVIIKVKDTGRGIPESAKEKLFDRFYQVDDSTTRDFGGTGIGLALVKELTKLIGGEISVESTLGKGSLFKLKFSVVKANESPESRQVIGGKDALKNFVHDDQELILIVDDNEELLSFISEILEENHNVITANNGRMAWEVIQKQMPDIVITDVMMPEINGYELIKLAKNSESTAHIQFIILSARSAQNSKEEGLSSGADAYLTKPFHFQELELIIGNLKSKKLKLRQYLFNQIFSKNTNQDSIKRTNPFLGKLNKFLDQNLDDTELGINNLTVHFGMSKSTLNRKLKSLINISPNEYIRQYRLKKSFKYLKGETTIAEVAYKVGFDNPSYFSQCFKEYYNISPSEAIKKSSE
ncbi:ATP-binding protein [Marivirga arenosa]|uniref:histidine kinase n=1 Tax=Marivirga arenosa TaxID=3059076 RepID=A0AA51N6R7_9BACT|nr:ATP-binding protein [Marivirga sp. ABR2-2]WMN07209.1 ATP-binding protein [Marivirga sp. ABR2-2]